MSWSSLRVWVRGSSTKFRAGVAITTIALFFVIHFLFCAHSALPEFTYHFTNSDMHANLEWARGIGAQGWLNPHPYHPYNDWMQEIAPYETWLRWWGGEEIFQQSPLYAYLLSVYFGLGTNLLYVHLAQCLGGAVLCVLLAALAWVVFESKPAAWLTLGLAALYSPFYGYAWPLLRDLLGWIVLVASLLSLAWWWKQWQAGAPRMGLSIATGLLLGLGLLARETFYLILPLSLAAVAYKCWKQQNWRPMAILVMGVLVTLAPLIVRNAAVRASPLSTSNRFAENFIEGNARSARPASFFIPIEMGHILGRSEGRPLAVISETMATHGESHSAWWKLQIGKILALFDPYEPPDNLSLYYLAEISPFVRFGLPHWLILIPGIGGLLLGIWRRDRRHAWLWLFLGCLGASLLFTTVLSRYRQSLALLWIPWAAYFSVAVYGWITARSYLRTAVAGIFLLAGWWFCLQPHSFFRSRDAYARSTEYRLAAVIYEKRGLPERARESLELLKSRQSLSH